MKQSVTFCLFFLIYVVMATGLNAASITNKKVKDIKAKVEKIVEDGCAADKDRLDTLLMPLKGTAYSSLIRNYKEKWEANKAHKEEIALLSEVFVQKLKEFRGGDKKRDSEQSLDDLDVSTDPNEVDLDSEGEMFTEEINPNELNLDSDSE